MRLEKKLANLDTLVQKGEFITAVAQFFDDNAKTISQSGTFVTHDKAEKLTTLGLFLANIAQTNEIKCYHQQILGDTSDSYFTFDFTNKQGERLIWHENIRRQWSKTELVLSEEYIIVNNIADLQPPSEAEQNTTKKSQKNTPKKTQDNLKKIEGISPKIEKLFFESGISTFEALSQTPLDTMQLILKAAGSRFRMHDPSTWAAQAALAHQGEWEKLAKWQVELNLGKKAK